MADEKPKAPGRRKVSPPSAPKAGAPRKPVAKKRAAKVAEGSGRGATPKAAKPRTSRAAQRTPPTSSKPRNAATRKPVPAPVRPEPFAPAAFPEEELIERAKFATLPPKRLFEEERFLFPETYGRNRVKLLVRDPEWLFAYFDVDPGSLAELGRELGERVLALSRLALKVRDPGHGGESLTVLPPGARSWYIHVDRSRRSYQADLGLLLPSGAFRHLAQSNTVATPRSGPAPERARSTGSWKKAEALPVLATRPAEAAVHAAPDVASTPDLGPWIPGESAAATQGATTPTTTPGGASDAFRR